MWVLGINWKWHDGAAALVDGDGRIVALAEEERFTGVKHAWDTYPTRAVQHCLAQAGITWRDLDHVAIGWDLPRLIPWQDEQRAELYTALFGPAAAHGPGPELVFVEHHLAHAYSAFHASGFDSAGVLVVDGAGEDEAISIFAADRAGALTLKRHWPRAYSLGAMYDAATRLLGFGALGAGKTMGLAPYGNDSDSTVLAIGDLVEGPGARPGPPFDWPTEMHYNDFCEQWMSAMTDRFGEVTKPAEHLDADPVAVRLAASAQRTVERAVRALHAETVCATGSPAVCLAGGVALNCVANGQLPEPVYIPPFPHDAGVALGAAWSISPPRRPALLDSPYLGAGPRIGGEVDALREAGFDVRELTPARVLDLLMDGGIGAIVEGRAEIGPRALGHRSIVAVPNPAGTRDRVNTLKGREQWRPLAPVTLPGHAPRLWPSQGMRELYMVGTATVGAYGREVMPALVHVDGTTRPQVVSGGKAPILEGVLAAMEEAGVPPVLMNTSFNGPGEPIVDSAADAVRAFTRLGLDFLVLGEHVAAKRGRQL
ncbi:carbamoyltransferase C-terminal domain-containing protein [Kutzneria kofuensis]|uniref:Carbamoyltransferase n=1 Tax=Kutzneria kofuensis TaxID=103725 RepID=A0A7W9KSZ0_9PSEU|nr:carbamoyltransferase C-terminal domain-containing protein [Kutzneria kofuensis]MBB5898120.1 carbamoyltransferase [Kutzneria kofuensis]